MAPLPQSVLIFSDKAGLDKWYREFKNANTRLTFLTTCTISESLCKEVHRADTSVPTGDKGARDADIAGKMHRRLADCAPIYECAWTSCNGIVKKGLTWFTQNKDSPIMDWHRSYNALRARLPTADEVEHYQEAALKWRRDIGYQINDLTAASDTPVVKVYRVSSSIITDIRDLLTDMRRRRNDALGIKDSEEKAPSDHVEHFRDWLNNGDWTVPCPWGDWEKQNKAGHYLYTTAAAGVLNKKYFKKEELKEKLQAVVQSIKAAKDDTNYSGAALERLEGIFSIIYASAQTFMAGQKTGATGGFVQQGSAIDTAFSSYYWAWAAGVKAETFPSLSSMLFAMGKTPVGRTKIEKKLRDCPYLWAQKFTEMFSTLGLPDAIHMHPGVLTPGRMASDMVCAFGAFPVSDPAKIADGSSSTRFLLNLRSDGNNPAGMSISAIFREFKAAYPDWSNELVVPAEHMLHQTFLSKMGPFVNVSQVPGQALSVNILPTEDD